MPDRDFYLNPCERNDQWQAAYLKHLENLLVLAGEANAAARAKAIYDLAKQIATVHWDTNDSSDATKVYNKMTIAELAKAAPGSAWAGLIRGARVTEGMIRLARPSAFPEDVQLTAQTMGGGLGKGQGVQC